MLIFENRLDPYISNGRITDPPFFMYSKAGPRPGDVERHYLTSDLNSERWGNANDTLAITAEYLLGHPYAEQMNLIFRSSNSAEIRMYSGGDSELLNSDGNGRYTVGAFDIIESSEDAVLVFEISGINGAEVPYGYGLQGDDDESGEKQIVALIEVSIAGGRKYSYIELIMAVYHQHDEMIREIAFRMLSEPVTNDEYNIDHLPDEIIENEILLWPAVRETADSGIEEMRRRATKKDIDFWMF